MNYNTLDDDDFEEFDPRKDSKYYVMRLDDFADKFFYENTPASNGIYIKGVREHVLYTGSTDFSKEYRIRKLTVPTYVDKGYIDEDGNRQYDDECPHRFATVWLPGDCSKLFGIYAKETFEGTKHEHEVIGLEEIDLSYIKDTSNVTNTSKMFRGNYNLKTVKFPKKPFQQVTTAIEMFRKSGITSIDLTDFGNEDTDITGMFAYTPNLENVITNNDAIRQASS